ncbi:hypothetical protein HRG84_07025 [Flavisolibacter sp. BT320]|jgi:flagellar basal body-associated protein FliL|nr:hypothetical protein [Flavisolibacter longurius]
MAEIHVEPKKQSSGSSWIWIVLALLVAAAVVYYLVTRNNETNDNAVPANTTGAVSLAPLPTPNTAYWC